MDAIANFSTSTTPAVLKTSPQHQKNSTINASIPPASTSTSSNASIPLASTSTSKASTNALITPASTSPSANASIPHDLSVSHSHHNSTDSALRPSKSARLPKITMAKFKGEVTQFRSFWDSFESIVHDRPHENRQVQLSGIPARRHCVSRYRWIANHRRKLRRSSRYYQRAIR